MFWPILRTVLFLLPAEFTHEISKFGMRLMALFMKQPKEIRNNPIGLAAGFDKNCEILDLLPKFGFGHAEIGTVTPKPQGGNPKPRLFRNPRDKTIFNRMGFNNLGAGIISERLKKIKPALPPGFKVGVNLGKNKITPDEQAAGDYARVARAFLDTADYFVINVSSPNTPGLRALQTIEALSLIVKAVQQELLSPANLKNRAIPIYVKLAPELTGDSLIPLLKELTALGVSGFVLTNTQAGHYIYRGESLPGGWSGKNLSTTSFNRLTEAKKALKGDFSVRMISVGGIMTTEEAIKRLKSGANEIQLYTGWIYQGPLFAHKIYHELHS
ncbi:MAG: quinone-dependent dihydroorotate dehydrogenase [Bdellovibrionales bacterium]|nr:quinone-dependent dihydroorotate dehydrogenase [Bdellovibrionales bacterium]